ESLRIWNVATARLEHKFKGPGRVAIQAIAVSPDGVHIAAGDADGGATILEAATGAEVHSLRMGLVASNPFRAVSIKKSLAYSPGGRLLAGTGEDGTQIDLWETQTRQRSTLLPGHSGFVNSVAFSRDGRLLASTGADRTVRVWDVAAAKCVA